MNETLGKSKATQKSIRNIYMWLTLHEWKFQRNHNAVLWRQTRRPTQMLARGRHSSSLKIKDDYNIKGDKSVTGWHKNS